MNLQGRDLSIGMQGDDVRFLNSALQQFGFSVDGEERFFSEATRKALLRFQRRNRLNNLSEFKKPRVMLIDSEVSAPRSKPEPDEERQGRRGFVHSRAD